MLSKFLIAIWRKRPLRLPFHCKDYYEAACEMAGKKKGKKRKEKKEKREKKKHITYHNFRKLQQELLHYKLQPPQRRVMPATIHLSSFFRDFDWVGSVSLRPIRVEDKNKTKMAGVVSINHLN